MEAIASRSELGVRVVGFIGSSTETAAGIPRFDEDDLQDVVEQRNVRRVVVTMGDRRGKLRVDQLLKLKTKGVYIQDGPEYYESITGKIPLESLRLSWLIFSPGFHVRAGLRLYKRIVSLILGSLAILITSPIMLLATIAVRLDSKGPAIFRQKRVGENGKLFTVYKFRSMFEGSDKIKLTPAEHGDPRVTRVGSGCAAPAWMSCRSCSTSSKATWRSSARGPSFPSRKKSVPPRSRSTASAGW